MELFMLSNQDDWMSVVSASAAISLLIQLLKSSKMLASLSMTPALIAKCSDKCCLITEKLICALMTASHAV
jgi:hypothetical protein